jgi:chromosome segregation ATPase
MDVETSEAIEGLHVRIDALDTSLRGEIAAMGADLRAEIAELGTALRGEMAAMGAGLRGEIAELTTTLRGENATMGESLRSEIRVLDDRIRYVEFQLERARDDIRRVAEQVATLNVTLDTLM